MNGACLKKSKEKDAKNLELEGQVGELTEKLNRFYKKQVTDKGDKSLKHTNLKTNKSFHLLVSPQKETFHKLFDMTLRRSFKIDKKGEKFQKRLKEIWAKASAFSERRVSVDNEETGLNKCRFGPKV